MIYLILGAGFLLSGLSLIRTMREHFPSFYLKTKKQIWAASIILSVTCWVRAFLDIDGILTKGHSELMSQDFMKALIAVALMALSAAPYSFFIEALEMSIQKGYRLSKQDIDKAYHWIQARKRDPRWNNGTRMTKPQVDALLALTYPIS